jgi:ABC-type transporter MlaC component
MWRAKIARVLVLFFVVGLLGTPFSQLKASPIVDRSKEFVSQLLELGKISKNTPESEENKKKSQALIEQLSKGVNFEALAKKSLGERWDSLRAETRTDFMQTLQETIETVLYPRAHRISAPLAEVEFKAHEKNKNHVIAKTQFEVERDGEIVERDLEFELVFDVNGTSIVDALIEGELVSHNLKRQFDQALEKRSFEEILAQMKRRLKQAQGKEEAAS